MYYHYDLYLSEAVSLPIFVTFVRATWKGGHMWHMHGSPIAIRATTYRVDGYLLEVAAVAVNLRRRWPYLAIQSKGRQSMRCASIIRSISIDTSMRDLNRALMIFSGSRHHTGAPQAFQVRVQSEV
jgi:hypothetical protein